MPGLPDTATRSRDSAAASAGVPGHTERCKVGKMVEIQISTKYNMNWGEEGKERFPCRAEAGAVLLPSSHGGKDAAHMLWALLGAGWRVQTLQHLAALLPCLDTQQ